MKSAKSKTALIVTPYLDHLGGGERYMLESASVIASQGYELFFAWDDLTQIKHLTKLLNINLANLKLDTSVLSLYFQNKPLQMYQATRSYDLIFYLSDGSIPLLGGKHNMIHFQVPFHHVGGNKLFTQLKFKNIYQVVVNSHFTKQIIDHEFKIDSQVIYPPISSIKSTSIPKEKLILSVGRFEPSVNIKQQDVLIKAFKRLQPQLPQWRLALVGGSSDSAWLAKLKQQAKGLPIDFYPNASYQQLTQLYQQASIFWHGAGYQVDEVTHPELVEHFGITTAEAITAKCIPLVVPKGGQKEIVPQSEYHWQTIDELINKTKLASERKLKPIKLSPIFSHFNFHQSISALI